MLPIVLWIFCFATALSSLRLFLGPTVEDRLVGLSLATSNIVIILVILAVKWGKDFYMDVALVYAILGFVGILAITRYLHRSEQ